MTLPSSSATVGKPWGTAPTPLAPAFHRRYHGDELASPKLCSAVGNLDLTLRELHAGFWDQTPCTAVPQKAFNSLRWQLAQLPVPISTEVLVSGTPVDRLLALPLTSRASQFMQAAVRRETRGGRLQRTLAAADVIAYFDRTAENVSIPDRNEGVLVLLELLALVEGSRELPQPAATAAVGQPSTEPGTAIPSSDVIQPSTAPTAGAPWGTASTPLAPAFHRRYHGDELAARKLRRAVGNLDLTLRELHAGFWDQAPWFAVPRKAFKSLRRKLAQLPVPGSTEVLVSGTPVDRLLDLPLTSRARKFVHTAVRREAHEGRLRRTLAAADVLAYLDRTAENVSIPDRNEGVLVLLELLALVEGSRELLQPAAAADAGQPAAEPDAAIPSSGVIRPSSAPTADNSWGTATTPLVPELYRQSYGNVMAAPKLRRAVGKWDLTLGELNSGFWDQAPWTAVPPEAFKGLRLQLAQFPVPRNVEVLVSGTRAEQLLALPLGTRAHNFVCKAVKEEAHEGRLRRTLSAGDVLAYRSVGVMVLLELLAVVEGSRELPQPAATADTGRRQQDDQRDEQSRDGAVSMPEPLAELLAAVREFRGAANLKEALEVDLGSLAASTGLASELNALSLGALHIGEGESHAAGLLTAIEAMQSELIPHEKSILDRRLFHRRPDTLASLGETLGVSRERVRQIEARLKRRLEIRLGRKIRIVAGAVSDRIAPIARPQDVDRQLESLFEDRHGRRPDDRDNLREHRPENPDRDQGEHQGLHRREDGGRAAVLLARRMLRDRLRYRARGELELDDRGAEAVDMLRELASEQQDDAGLLDEEALQSRLPDPSWTEHWELLVEACGFHRIDGLLGLRNTQKARVKAAVLNMGRVASREEIAARCSLATERTVGCLSALPSVARADRTRWGLVDWIEDVYEGVANEILQRIDEDGGATRVERVLEELPRLFGASEVTVRAYLKAPQFEVANGWVRRANASAVKLKLRLLDDAIDGRDEQGRPWWGFQVKAIHFQGYSVPNLPPEIAHELGCPPNGRIEVPLADPPDCRPLSLIWRLTSLTGPNLGFLSRPLERLGARPGDRVRLILRSDSSVELRREHPPQPSDGPAAESKAADDILQRLKQRRQVL